MPVRHAKIFFDRCSIGNGTANDGHESHHQLPFIAPRWEAKRENKMRWHGPPATLRQAGRETGNLSLEQHLDKVADVHAAATDGALHRLHEVSHLHTRE